MHNKQALLLFAAVGLAPVAACSGKSSSNGTTGGAGMPSAGESSAQAGSLGSGGSSPSGGSFSGAGTASHGGAISVGTNTSLDDLPRVYAMGGCALFARCWKTFSSFTSETCDSYFEGIMREQSLSNVAAAIKAGTVVYHPEALPGCIAELQNVACDSDAFPECLALFAGTKKTGEDCSIDQECDSESECVPGAMCPGKCTKLVELNGTCNATRRCAHGLKCAEPPTGDGICQVPVSEGKPCNDETPCSGLLECLGRDAGDPTSMGTCRSPDALFSAGEGAACALGSAVGLCKPGLSCVFSETTSSPGTCRPPLAADAPCQLALPEQCPAGQYCKITSPSGVTPLTGQCTKTPGLGEACGDATDTFTVCASGQYCGAGKVCTLDKHLGEACTSSRDCVSTHCGTDGKCFYPLDCEP